MIWKYLVLFPLGSPRAEIKYSWGRSWAGTFFSEMGSTEDPQAFGGDLSQWQSEKSMLGSPESLSSAPADCCLNGVRLNVVKSSDFSRDTRNSGFLHKICFRKTDL